MHPRLMPLVILYIAIPTSMSAKTLFDVSHSVNESERRGIFVANARVAPSTFQWQGHTVSLKETWFETTETPQVLRLCLKTEVDGDITGEHRFSDAMKSYLEFRRSSDPQSKRGGRLMFLPKQKIAKALIRGAYGEEIHYLPVPQSDASALKIVAFTRGRTPDNGLAAKDVATLNVEILPSRTE